MIEVSKHFTPKVAFLWYNDKLILRFWFNFEASALLTPWGWFWPSTFEIVNHFEILKNYLTERDLIRIRTKYTIESLKIHDAGVLKQTEVLSMFQ